MSLPNQFLIGGGAIASYDWLDLTSGVGYRRYYPCATSLTAGIGYFLSTKALDSYPIAAYATLDQGAATLEIDLDFDITFNVPSIVGGGEAFINLKHAIWSGAGDTNNVYPVINVIHVGTGGEAVIGTAQGVTRAFAGGPATEWYRECIKVAITKKKFVVGDKLRFNVQMYGWKPAGGGGNGVTYLWHDPSTRVTHTDILDTTSGTDITFDCPFVVSV